MYALFTALLIVTAHATPSPAFKTFLDRTTRKVTCANLSAPFATWAEPAAPPAPAPKVEAAMATLEALPNPTAAEIAMIRSEMSRNFAETFVRYNPVCASGCIQARMTLARIIIKAAGKDDKQRREFAPRLRAVLLRPTYEALLDAMINMIVLENGIDQGLWSAPGGLRAELKELRTQAKAKSVEFENTYGEEFRKADIGVQPNSEASIARLNALPNRDHIRGGLLHEMEMAADLLKRNHALTERVH